MDENRISYAVGFIKRYLELDKEQKVVGADKALGIFKDIELGLMDYRQLVDQQNQVLVHYKRIADSIGDYKSAVESAKQLTIQVQSLTETNNE